MPDSPYHCEHPTTELRQRTYSNGSTHYVDQCLRCGAQLQSYKHDSNEVAQAKLRGVIPDYDEELRDKFTELASANYREQVACYREEREDADLTWWQWYNEYLKSPKWSVKRTAVLRRDQHICQGCRNRRAMHAHHLTYRHVGNEFLFELTSLCAICHARIHLEQDDGKDDAGPGPQLSP